MSTARVRITETVRTRVVEIADLDLDAEETGVRTTKLARFARVFAALSPLGHDAAAREAKRVLDATPRGGR